MDKYKMFPIVLGEFVDYEKSWLLYNTCCGKKIDALILAYLIIGNGKNILVDTGCCDPATGVKNQHTPFKQTTDMNLLSALNQKGLRADQIDCIIHTHLHWDHCYNDGIFPKAKIYVQKKEVQYAICPLPFHYDEYETAHFGYSNPYPWLPSMDRFEYIDGDFLLLPGLNLIFLPGHTPGFQGVLVETEKGKCMLAGDSIPLYENWLGVNNKEHIPSAVHVNTLDCYSSFDKIESLSDYILAGRDKKILKGQCVWIDHEKGGQNGLGYL